MTAPRDIILEPSERVLLATRPLFLWEPLVLLDLMLFVLALYFGGLGQPGLVIACLAVFIVLTLWILFRWIPWSAKWFVLTDRRVIARWGVFNRNQAALLLGLRLLAYGHAYLVKCMLRPQHEGAFGFG